MYEKSIDISNTKCLDNLFGSRDIHLNQIQKMYDVKIFLKKNNLIIKGEESNVRKAYQIIQDILKYLDNNKKKNIVFDLDMMMESYENSNESQEEGFYKLIDHSIDIKTRKTPIKAKNYNQKYYIEKIIDNDIVFSIGPAGTGKTYLAVAMALKYLYDDSMKRIILTRPAIEAGEKLGFLPGDLYEKINPYVRPLYDAIYDMMPPEKLQTYIQKNIIEIAPLAYMRGRTLNSSFIILDEAQNTTPEQMKMVLTRLGFNSKMIITGDITQIDLPDKKSSGLIEVIKILKDVKGIGFMYFDKKDVVRHRLVKDIVDAYEKFTISKQSHNEK